ncbi:MAG: hypothetical protein JXR48_18885 [Candidatus Delongbacteria bacterium]|nr:hypothetical protein [Candidatus Delongbacteria bacterium]MBN2837026.1 hypothetical protein [Candidatus Delongbacteria bacterium]
MSSDIVKVLVSKKNELKKFMSKIEEVGSAVIFNPLKLSDSELVTERYIFNKPLSSINDPNAVPIINFQRSGENVVMTTLGKVGKSVVSNLTSAYISSPSNFNFFIPVDVEFKSYFSEKNIYLKNKKEVFDLSNDFPEGLTGSRIHNNNIYVVTTGRDIYYSKLSQLQWIKIELYKVNTISIGDDNRLYSATENGVFVIDENKIEEFKIPSAINIHEVLLHENKILLNIQRKKIISYEISDDGKEHLSEYNVQEGREISLKGCSNFFGGVLTITSNPIGRIDNVSFLTIPSLKVMEHPKRIHV